MFQMTLLDREYIYVRKEGWINYFDLRVVDPFKTVSLISMD